MNKVEIRKSYAHSDHGKNRYVGQRFYKNVTDDGTFKPLPKEITYQGQRYEVIVMTPCYGVIYV